MVVFTQCLYLALSSGSALLCLSLIWLGSALSTRTSDVRGLCYNLLSPLKMLKGNFPKSLFFTHPKLAVQRVSFVTQVGDLA